MDVQAYINTHPNLAAGITLVAGWFAPTPANCRRWLADATALLKGATMQLNATQVKEAVKDAQELVKLALEYVPGAGPDEKAKTITDEVTPLFLSAIGQLNLPQLVNDFAVKILGWMIAAEVKAAETVA